MKSRAMIGSGDNDAVRRNRFGQPIGISLPGWKASTRPAVGPMIGRWCRVVPLDPDRHATSLFDEYSMDPDERMWTYMPYGPFRDQGEYIEWVQSACRGDDPLFFAVVDAVAERAMGVASYLRIDTLNGSIEVGHIAYSARLRRTPAATEAMFLMAGRAFDHGYRRYEWKCDALNEPSRSAAERLGFTFEGVFRQAVVYKERNRDTAWYSILDHEWPVLRAAFDRWLDPGNFDESGIQRCRLSDLTRRALHNL